MTDAMVSARIKSIELQLAVLKARLEHEETAPPAARALGDLFGLMAGTGTASDADIDQAEYTIRDERRVAKESQ